MLSSNLNLLIDLALFIGGAIYISRLLHLKHNPESVLNRYKKGSKQYKFVADNIAKASSRSRVVVLALAMLAVVVKTAIDILKIVDFYGESAMKQLLFVFGFALVLYLPITIILAKIVGGRAKDDRGDS